MRASKEPGEEPEPPRHHVLRSEADAEGLIPCYVRGCLSAKDRRAFVRYLLNSPSLQRKVLNRLQVLRPAPEDFIERLAASPQLQRKVLARVQGELAALDVLAPTGVFGRLRRVRHGAAGAAVEITATLRDTLRAWKTRFNARTSTMLTIAARPRAVAALYVLSAIQSGLVAGLLVRQSSHDERFEYVALSTAPPVEGRHLVQVLEGARLPDLFALLRELGLEIVAGPDSIGLIELARRASEAPLDAESQRLRLRARPDLIVVLEPRRS